MAVTTLYTARLPRPTPGTIFPPAHTTESNLTICVPEPEGLTVPTFFQVLVYPSVWGRRNVYKRFSEREHFLLSFELINLTRGGKRKMKTKDVSCLALSKLKKNKKKKKN